MFFHSYSMNNKQLLHLWNSPLDTNVYNNLGKQNAFSTLFQLAVKFVLGSAIQSSLLHVCQL